MSTPQHTLKRRALASLCALSFATGTVALLPVTVPEFAAQAEAAVYQDYTYTDMGDHIQLDGLSLDGMTKVQANGGVLPDFPLEINGKKVTAIGYRAFYKNKLTQLPGSWGNITTIGELAFLSNDLTQLPGSWGNITTIGSLAFFNNQLMTLPESWGNITTIDARAFEDNQLTKLPDWNTWKPMKDAKSNPQISQVTRCTRQPLNVALVFDTSNSIGQEGIDGYKQATSDFVDAVSDKGISIASFDFSINANAPRHLSKPNPVLVTDNSKQQVKDSLNEHFAIKGSTNWESGLINVRDNNTITNGKPRYDMVVFISDGFPNEKVSTENIGFMQAAQRVANNIKQQGSRIVSMGVGPELQGDPISGLSNLLPLSGLEENSDWYLGTWDELSSMLVHASTNVTCGTQVDARAQIIDGEGIITDPSSPGWQFTTEVINSKHDNVTIDGDARRTTPNALWLFPFEFNDKTGDDLRTSTVDIKITQTAKDGFTYYGGVYKIVDNEDGKVLRTVQLDGETTIVKDVPADARIEVVAQYHSSDITPPPTTTVMPPSTVTTTVTPPVTTVTKAPKTETTTTTITESATTTVTLPSTVTTTVTPPVTTVTEAPKTETTTMTTTESATTTVTETPQTETVTETPQRETVTLTPEKETETVTETPQRETVTLTPEKETETVTEIPQKETVTETPKTETVTYTPEKETVTETPKVETVTHTPEKETVTETPKASTETSTVTAPQVTVTETPKVSTKTSTVTVPQVTVTETPKQVTETTTLPQKTVTEQVPTTVVENKTEIVKLPPVTVTETEKQEPVTVTATPEKVTETVKVPGEKTTVVETKPDESVIVAETPRDDNSTIVTAPDTPTEDMKPEDVMIVESTPQSPNATASRILASTGVNVAGLVGIAGLLIGAAVFVTRRKK